MSLKPSWKYSICNIALQVRSNSQITCVWVLASCHITYSKIPAEWHAWMKLDDLHGKSNWWSMPKKVHLYVIVIRLYSRFAHRPDATQKASSEFVRQVGRCFCCFAFTRFWVQNSCRILQCLLLGQLLMDRLRQFYGTGGCVETACDYENTHARGIVTLPLWLPWPFTHPYRIQNTEPLYHYEELGEY